MGDAGESLVDAEGRIQERMEELARERKPVREAPNPDSQRKAESLRLARTELQRQLNAATHPTRKEQLSKALEEIDRRLDAR